MTNKAPFKHKQGHPGGAPGEKTSGALNWRRGGGGWRRHSSTLLQGAKTNDSGPPVCDLLDTPLVPYSWAAKPTPSAGGKEKAT